MQRARFLLPDFRSTCTYHRRRWRGKFHTRTPELQMSELVENGITTVVGLLGTDGITRSVDNLYAKTRVLCEEGVSAYMLTGAYGYPSPTITGETDRDIVFVNEIWV